MRQHLKRRRMVNVLHITASGYGKLLYHLSAQNPSAS